MEIFSNLCGLLKISELYFHVMRFHETSFVNFLYPPINRFKILSYEVASSKIKNTPLEKISIPMYHSFRAICYCELVPNDLNFLKFHHIEVIGSQLKFIYSEKATKILRNFPLTFGYSTYGQKLGEDFAKFCGLLRIYEL